MDAKLRYKVKIVKIVFFYIVDRLRAKETGLIPESVIDVFHQLKKKEILTGIATGWGIFGVVPELMDLKWANIEFPVKEGKIKLKLSKEGKNLIEIPDGCKVDFIDKNKAKKTFTRKGSYSI